MEVKKGGTKDTVQKGVYIGLVKNSVGLGNAGGETATLYQKYQRSIVGRFGNGGKLILKTLAAAKDETQFKEGLDKFVFGKGYAGVAEAAFLLRAVYDGNRKVLGVVQEERLAWLKKEMLARCYELIADNVETLYTLAKTDKTVGIDMRTEGDSWLAMTRIVNEFYGAAEHIREQTLAEEKGKGGGASKAGMNTDG